MEADVRDIVEHITGTTRMDPGERAYLLGQVEKLQSCQEELHRLRRYRELTHQLIEYGMRQERRTGALYHALGNVAHTRAPVEQLRVGAKAACVSYVVSLKGEPVRLEKIMKEAGF